MAIHKMWNAHEHSNDDNTRWTWLRAIEWINWPLFFSQPIIPVLLYFFPKYYISIIVWLIAIDALWQLIISRHFVSALIANFGALFVRLKLITCPIMSLLLWQSHQSFLLILMALLWSYVTLLIQVTINVPLGICFKTTYVGPVQNLFMSAIGYEITTTLNGNDDT